ncbi:glycosyltransferase [Pusillimonas sp. TS35]|uniref:glycosyltransferase family 4 protein n=1 Tax=Paracandidimonas lactea TaxID=2895524 RepID=UPI0013718EBE|nr:glycosyltransferase family 4 protein [Paracandidimonas lactea]MYN13575.1 glycosyltransferase [Pusillimonas sp. TS35]
MTHHKLLVVTTVPETLLTILQDQPRFLAQALGGSIIVELATSPGPDAQCVADAEGVMVHGVPMARGIAPLKDIYAIVRMMHLLRRERPDIIHSYTAKAGLIAMIAGWLCRVPVRVHTFTGLVFPTERGFKRSILIAVDRLVCAAATRVVPEGLGVLADLRDHHITGKPLQVIGHGNIAGVDTRLYDRDAPGLSEAAAALRTQLTIPTDALVYCYVGRLNRDKGLHELLAAFDALPPTAHLALAGALDITAPISPYEQNLIASHPRIHALGFMQDVRPLMTMSDVLVLPSYREGFPNVVLQAGAMALPVIATDINGCNEVITPNHNGWLVPPHDTPALRIAMEAAANLTSEQRREMGIQARIRIQQRYERDTHWQNMLAFYRQLAAGLSDSRHWRPHTETTP